MTPLAIAPDPSRCGPAPVNLHARFAGTGIDTNGGPYTVAASGCLSTQTRRLSELRATDTYNRNGDSIDIDDFTLRVSPATCVATNKHPVRFTVAGCSGSLARASRHGHFDFAMPYPLCAAAQPPFTAYVWFSGTIQARSSRRHKAAIDPVHVRPQDNAQRHAQRSHVWVTPLA